MDIGIDALAAAEGTDRFIFANAFHAFPNLLVGESWRRVADRVSRISLVTGSLCQVSERVTLAFPRGVRGSTFGKGSGSIRTAPGHSLRLATPHYGYGRLHSTFSKRHALLCPTSADGIQMLLQI